jgi:hypothetical protein
MLRSPVRPADDFWPDETIIVLPETPRVRLSPRRQIVDQDTTTTGWHNPTIRMYHDSEDSDDEQNFTMNPEFIESTQQEE